jgi:hypothetical protein
VARAGEELEVGIEACMVKRLGGGTRG